MGVHERPRLVNAMKRPRRMHGDSRVGGLRLVSSDPSKWGRGEFRSLNAAQRGIERDRGLMGLLADL